MANLAAANLWQRKTRSAISVFGIAIGIALLLVLKGMLIGTIEEITSRMKNTGADIFVYSRLAWAGGTDPIPMAWADKIKETAGDKIESVVLLVQDVIPQVGVWKQENRLWGVRSEDLAALNVELIQDGKSRYFRDSEYEMLIDSRLAEHSRLKVGDTTRHLGRDWKIVGIVDVGVGVRVYIPFGLLQILKDKEGSADIFAIKLKEGADAQEVATAIKRIQVPVPGKPEEMMGLPVEPIVTATLFETFRDKAGIINIFANYVTFVALIISFLMILLTMYTVVVERTRDIGILKSLGASRMFIARNIITESLALAVAGVVVGTILSIVASKFIPWVSMLDVSISGEWVLIAAAMGLAGGVLGAIVPAMLAANKDPVAAITYE
jgi:putative ABC transport system permease protein